MYFYENIHNVHFNTFKGYIENTINHKLHKYNKRDF